MPPHIRECLPLDGKPQAVVTMSPCFQDNNSPSGTVHVAVPTALRSQGRFLPGGRAHVHATRGARHSHCSVGTRSMPMLLSESLDANHEEALHSDDSVPSSSSSRGWRPSSQRALEQHVSGISLELSRQQKTLAGMEQSLRESRLQYQWCAKRPVGRWIVLNLALSILTSFSIEVIFGGFGGHEYFAARLHRHEASKLLGDSPPSEGSRSISHESLLSEVAFLRQEVAQFQPVAECFERRGRSLILRDMDFEVVDGNLRVHTGVGETDGVHGRGNVVVGNLHQVETARNSFLAGFNNRAEGAHVSVLGGNRNTAGPGNFASVAGGEENTASGVAATVAGGGSNVARGSVSQVAGGEHNTAAGRGSSVVSGFWNSASGARSAVVGGFSNGAHGEDSAVLGGEENSATGAASSVVGGLAGAAAGRHATIGGGKQNVAEGPHASVAGGRSNSARGLYATVSGGFDNRAEGDHSAAAGGAGNVARGGFSTVAGGSDSVAEGEASSVAGGFERSARNAFSATCSDDGPPIAGSGRVAGAVAAAAAGVV